MKEIKAFVRFGPLVHVIDRLEDEGARDLAVTHVRASGALAVTEPEYLQRVHSYRNEYADVAKVEIVCADHEASASGTRDDGRIFVLNIEQAVNLGDGDAKPRETSVAGVVTENNL